MPTAPPQVCTVQGCPRPAYGGLYCLEHRHIAKQEHRPNSHQRGYTRKWGKVRATFLKDNPLCRHCGQQGRTKPATEVDHIIPHKGDNLLFWDSRNWQALCKSCHSSKTAKEQTR